MRTVDVQRYDELDPFKSSSDLDEGKLHLAIPLTNHIPQNPNKIWD